MDPVTLGIVGATASAAGAGVSAIGAVGQGEAAAAEARYQAQVAANNQRIALQNANYALQAGSESTFQTGLRERARAGTITAGIAAHGMDVGTGSAAQVRTSQTELGQQAELTTAENAELTAYGYRTQATGFGAEAQLQQAEAPRDVAAGFLTGAGGLLGSAGNLPLKWGSYLNPTPPGAIGGSNPLGV